VDERRAHAHGHQQLIEPIVEGQRQDVEDPVVLAEPQIGGERVRGEAHRTMRHHHRLGTAGASGGVDQRGEVARAAGRRPEQLAVPRELVDIEQSLGSLEGHAPGLDLTWPRAALFAEQRGDHRRALRIRDDEARFAIPQQKSQLVPPRLRMNEHEDAASEQAGIEADRGRSAPAHVDRDGVPGLEPFASQAVSETRGPLQDLGVAIRLIAFFEQRMLGAAWGNLEQAVVEQSFVPGLHAGIFASAAVGFTGSAGRAASRGLRSSARKSGERYASRAQAIGRDRPCPHSCAAIPRSALAGRCIRCTPATSRSVCRSQRSPLPP
jgi:hypothetical protein